MDINDRRTWDFKWTAPADDTAIASFLIFGNAVNGNGAPSGDEWNQLDVEVAGINATRAHQALKLLQS